MFPGENVMGEREKWAENVTALFVASDSIYKGFGLDAWDIDRNALNYHGSNPVVAHPPCNLWVNMAAVNWKRYKKQRPAWYPKGSDGGCFQHALETVLSNGGVLEHPAFSHAWEAHGLPRPEGEGWRRVDLNDTPVWVCEVWQSAYGHRARKRTWLLYSGARAPFELNWTRRAGTHQVGWFDRVKPTLSKKAALATPWLFAVELIKLAQHAGRREYVSDDASRNDSAAHDH